MPSLQSYRQLPSIESGYPLDDVWSVVVPIARQNEITNPSFETNTTSWTAVGGSIARSTTQQYHGAYSLAITPTATTTDGARYDTVSLTSGTTYAYSAKVRGVAGLNYLIAIETTGGVALATVTFRATGRWQWVTGYYTETSTTTRRFTARKSGHASIAIFYLDGVQIETIVAGELVSTYIDGDQLGLVPNQNPPAYVWNGTPHGSTSKRSGLTRAGGMVIPFKKYGFILTAIIGLGLAQPQNTATEYARIDGGYDDYTRKPTRQFTLAGRFQGRTYAELRRNRGALADLLDRDLIAQDQRLTLLRHVEDRNGNIITSEARVLAKYTSGLAGNTDNMHAEQAPITFTQYLPNVLSDGESGASLAVQLSVSNASHIAQRSAAGVWGPLSTGANNNVWSLLYASDGKLYAGGEFTTIGGVSANRIAYWDGTAWNAMGTGGNAGAVLTIAEGPDGSIYAGGDPTSFGGVANTNFIAKWNGSVWSSVTGASVANNAVQKLAFAPDGNLYAGGLFTSIGGVAATRIAKMTAAGVWSVMSTGSTTTVSAIAIAPNSRVYIGGDTSGDAVPDVSYWTGAAWVSTGSISGGSTLIEALTFGPNGILYAGGSYTSIGGVTAGSIAQYNGVAWTPLGTGVAKTASTPEVLQITVQPDGTVLVAGDFDTAGGITTVKNIARWNGSAWSFLDFDIAWSSVRATAQKIDGTLAIGGTGATSSGVAGASTTITNPGTARSYPMIVINGPSSGTARIYQITNYTTNRTIYLNLTISLGEVATLIFQPDTLSFTSDFQGNIASTILPGSNAADFFLQPGANIISFFSASSTVTATLFYRPAYASIDDVP